MMSGFPVLLVGGPLAEPKFIMLPGEPRAYRIAIYEDRARNAVALSEDDLSAVTAVSFVDYADTGFKSGHARVFAPEGDLVVAARWLGDRLCDHENMRLMIAEMARYFPKDHKLYPAIEETMRRLNQRADYELFRGLGL